MQDWLLPIGLFATAAVLGLSSCAGLPGRQNSEPRLFRVILPVTDITQAAAFYAAVFDMPGDRVSPGRHYFTCGQTILACFDPAQDGDNYKTVPNPEWLYFAVADLEATLATCMASGAGTNGNAPHEPTFGEIATRPWGERSFYVLDPFGNKLCFVDETTLFTAS